MAESHSQPAPSLDICNPAAREGREKLPSSKYTLGWGVGAECRMQGREMLPTLVVSWQVSAVRGEEAGHFHEV